jgi:choline dehydrogenase-like flavoprotein
MRLAFNRTIRIFGPDHEIPSPLARVELHPTVADANGLNVVRLSGTTHAETLRTANFMREKALAWLRASGAKKAWSPQMGLWLSAGQHQAGTCRMGEDPASSVCDPWGRVHGINNLLCADASLHPTNGGFNPVLTIMALSWRNAEKLAQSL